jgi:hypothetical protein
MNYQFPMHVHQGLAAWHEVGKDRLWNGELHEAVAEAHIQRRARIARPSRMQF